MTEFTINGNTYNIEEKTKFIVCNKEFNSQEEAEEFLRSKDLTSVLNKYRIDNDLEYKLKIPNDLYRKYFSTLALADHGFKVYVVHNKEELEEFNNCVININATSPGNTRTSRVNKFTKVNEIKYPYYIFYNKFHKTCISLNDILEDGDALKCKYEEYISAFSRFKNIVKDNNLL